MTNQFFQIHFAVHYEPHRLFLQLDGSAIRSQQRLLFDTDSPRVNNRVSVHRLREQKHPAARSRGVHSCPDQAVAPYRQNCGVGSTAFRLLANRFQGVGTRSINALPQAECCFRYCKPLRIQIGSDYPRASLFGQCSQYDTNRALTNDQDCFSLLQA